MKPIGKVYLVGAGPGDPGLITVKGLACIERSDVLIYDYLASSALLKHTRDQAEVIYVGKKEGEHTLSQEEINALLVEKAQKGLLVTRLKGGDPFIFGRGAEEVEALVRAEIPFEIVPGVTSAIAAPAYAGIPLTHRGFTSTVTFVTGQEDPTKEESMIDWAALAGGRGTIVFLMGVKNLPSIVSRLIKHGLPPDMPVALIRWGTTPAQLTVSGTLATIVERVRSAGLKPPAVIVVGRVVSLREALKWFESRPLFGKRIVVTRARQQASPLVRLLSDLGAECLEYPTIRVVPPDDWKPLDMALERLSSYDWLVFTSVNGVNFFFQRLLANDRTSTKKDGRDLRGLRIAVIGPATAQRLLDFGLRSDIVPRSYKAEAIVEEFGKQDIKGKKILLPRAKEARPILPAELKKMGAIVDEVAAYQTEAVYNNAGLLIKQLEEKRIDLITFTSSSTVKNFHALLPPEKFKTLLERVAIACIGPVTADTARKLGFNVHIIAESFTIGGLCQVILRHYSYDPLLFRKPS